MRSFVLAGLSFYQQALFARTGCNALCFVTNSLSRGGHGVIGT